MKTDKRYYKISTPTFENSNTGNASVSLNDLSKFDKDFLFDQTVDGKHYKVVLDKRWVLNNAKFVVNRKTDPITLQEKRGCFYLINISDILNYISA